MRLLPHAEVAFNYGIGVLSALWNVALFQSLPSDAGAFMKDPIAYASLLALSGVLVTIFTTRSIAALNKLADLPSKEDILSGFKEISAEMEKRHEEFDKELRSLGDRVLVLETKEEGDAA